MKDPLRILGELFVGNFDDDDGDDDDDIGFLSRQRMDILSIHLNWIISHHYSTYIFRRKMIYEQKTSKEKE